MGAFALLPLVGCSAEVSDGTDLADGESEDALLAGRKVSEREAATLIRSVGFPENVVGKMLCTIKYESRFYERATNKNSNGTGDYGLFQINEVHLGRRGCPTTTADLFDAQINAKCAFSVYSSQGLNAWYAYKRHRAECDAYPAPPILPDEGAAHRAGERPSPADGGRCWSATLGRLMSEGECVQSKANGEWFQCIGTEWYRGIANGAGPMGACVALYPNR